MEIKRIIYLEKRERETEKERAISYKIKTSYEKRHREI